MTEIDATLQLTILERELSSALAEYEYHGTIGAQSTASNAIDAFVDALRASGHSPESMISTIKAIAVQAGYDAAPNATTPSRVPDMRIDGFLSRAVARYFGARTDGDTLAAWVPVTVVI